MPGAALRALLPRQTGGLEHVRSPHRRREDGVWLEDLAGPADPDRVAMSKEEGLEMCVFIRNSAMGACVCV